MTVTYSDGFPVVPVTTGNVLISMGERYDAIVELRDGVFPIVAAALHGHTFQVVDGNGSGPRKDTTIVLPMETVEVDFDADNPGQWMLHCHNVYHGEARMMGVLSYVQ